MSDGVLLTDARRDVLKDEFDGASSTEATHKSRIRTRSRTALDELIEIAGSPAIDNEDVFDPVRVRALLENLLCRVGPDYWHDDQGKLKDHAELTDDYERYSNEVYVQANSALRGYEELKSKKPMEDAYWRDPVEMWDPDEDNS